MSKRKFHHGNLRAALLELAEQEIEKQGYEALSLRDLAAKLGVSTAAPYRHFATKDSLLDALANSGIEQLQVLYQEAAGMELDAREQLRTACRAYLDFAKKKPELFRLIFVSDATWNAEQPQQPHTPSAFDTFERLVSKTLDTNDPSSWRIAALLCWCIIHGFAALRMNGRLDQLGNASILAALEQSLLEKACKDLGSNL